GQELRRLQAVHARHADVHDHDVRPAPLREGDRALAVARLADDADVRRPRQRQPQALAHDLVVVDDQAGNFVCGHPDRRFYGAPLLDREPELLWILGRLEAEPPPVADSVPPRQLPDGLLYRL